MSRRLALADTATAAVVFLFAFLYFYLFHRLGWFMEDEGVLYYHYLRVYHGQVPYRDFFTGYGPIGYYVHAWAFDLFGVSINAIRILTAAVNATTAAGLYAVGRRVTTPGFALIPPAFFVAMQPWDIAVMVFQNSPYPSWYALALTVWGTWAMLRFLESPRPTTRRIWLIVAGLFGGAGFFCKQNTGTFFLWGITGFLAAYPGGPVKAGEQERPLQCYARWAYLALIPLGSVLLVRNFLNVATLSAFIVPVSALALAGARRPFERIGWWAAVERLLWVGAGSALAIAPWCVYFSWQMGVGPFFNAILFLGAEVDRNLYVPYPSPTGAVIGGVGFLAASVLILRWKPRSVRMERSGTWRLRPVLLLMSACVVGIGAWQVAVLSRIIHYQYNLWQIYAYVSERLDNSAAYLALAILATGVVLTWPSPTERAACTASARLSGCVLWVATCTFLGYYPRMDYAHLVTALPLVLVAGVGFLPRLRQVAGVDTGAARVCFNVLSVVVVGLVVGLKSAPRLYSRVMVAHTGSGVSLVPTPHETLDLERAHLYFPIYLERQRLHINAFQELIEYVRKTTRKGDAIFAFPALPMVYFLSDRDNPTRHDYFLGDNVSFREQLEVIRTLDADDVSTVVVDNDPTNYFVVKSQEFTRLIWDYLGRRYYLERRIGPYDVLRRYGTDEHPRAEARSASSAAN